MTNAGKMVSVIFLMSSAVFLFCSFHVEAQLNMKTSREFVERVLPKHSKQFKIEELPDSSRDTFEIENGPEGTIILRGNNGVSVASALYYYLKEYTNCQITWNGTNLKLNSKLPRLKEKVRKTSPYTYRYYMNYCTFNYSMSWWDWPRWEKEIDWMAMHGINMPLAITGQEYVWQQLYKELGFSDQQLAEYFCGPTYFAWFWMGNIDGWGGPLPQHWFDSHRDLQQRILDRERAFGMKPVLPAFTGHVPASFSKIFPNAKLKRTNWKNDFDDTYILDAEDPLFASIGKRFLEAQTKIYGTNHLYSADTFNENEPPSDAPEYLASLSKQVYEGMKLGDAEAIWVMQGWLFFSDRQFWKNEQVKALLDAVPDDRMILLDLATEIEPVWKRTEAFYGKPWIWNMLHNFGGNISMFGRMDGVASGPALARTDATSGKMVGIGLTMEGIEQNPVLYELMTDHTWRDEVIKVDDWLKEYIDDRYGSKNPNAIKAWNILHTTVYNGKDIRDGAESIIAARPTFEPGTRWVKTTLNYKAEDLLPAWDEMIKASTDCKAYDGFKYDLVDITRQVMANYAKPLHDKIVEAYNKKDLKTFDVKTKEFITLIDDIDALLATRTDFLLGKWIDEARRCGITTEEKDLYERNARNLITLWGSKDNRLHEYSCRQWSGLLSDFYKPRWQEFFNITRRNLEQGSQFDAAAFEKDIRVWEWKWVNSNNPFQTKTSGNSIRLSNQLYKQYRDIIGECYRKNG